MVYSNTMGATGTTGTNFNLLFDIMNGTSNSNSTSNSTNINHLPPEMKLEICKYLDSTSIKQLRLTDRTISQLVGVDTIKKKIQLEKKVAREFLEMFSFLQNEENIPSFYNLELKLNLFLSYNPLKIAAYLMDILKNKSATNRLCEMNTLFNRLYNKYYVPQPPQLYQAHQCLKIVRDWLMYTI